MPDYRRLKIPGATYFFTVVTDSRKPLFSDETARRVLKEATSETTSILPFKMDAWVLLPDHLHCLWTLPAGDRDFSKRWGIIKSHFTKKMKTVGWTLPTDPTEMKVGWALPTKPTETKVGWALPTKPTETRVGWALPTEVQQTPSRFKHREGMIWQRRFWEHLIRDEKDFNRHCDYIHYNPVKHGLIDDPKKWECSSILQFIEEGLYPQDWGDSVGEEILSMDFE
jgi:putative transposase